MLVLPFFMIAMPCYYYSVIVCVCSNVFKCVLIMFVFPFLNATSGSRNNTYSVPFVAVAVVFILV